MERFHVNSKIKTVLFIIKFLGQVIGCFKFFWSRVWFTCRIFSLPLTCPREHLAQYRNISQFSDEQVLIRWISGQLEESKKYRVCAQGFALLQRDICKQKRKIFYYSSSCWLHFLMFFLALKQISQQNSQCQKHLGTHQDFQKIEPRFISL